MNRAEYLDALTFCYRMETAGALAGEVAMLLREDADERRKLDSFRRLEAATKTLCAQALGREQVALPVIEPKLYRNAYKLGLRLGEADWDDFLDRFEATIHADLFAGYLLDADGNELAHEYGDVDIPLLRHLLAHEVSLVTFVERERAGRGDDSTAEIEQLLSNVASRDLIGPDDPVGW